MKAGSVDHFGDSLAEAIENALAAEMQSAKHQALPDAGKQDRRILFSAIAQGLLAYLREHESDIQITLTHGLPGMTATVAMQAAGARATPGGSAGSRSVRVRGDSFPAGANVTITWDQDGTPLGSATSDGGGSFDATITLPSALQTAVQTNASYVVGVRDNDGNAAAAAVVF
jgi:hypothetical protein